MSQVLPAGNIKFFLRRRLHYFLLNFLSWISRIHYQTVWVWLLAALTAERITTMVSRGGHLGAAHDVQRE